MILCSERFHVKKNQKFLAKPSLILLLVGLGKKIQKYFGVVIFFIGFFFVNHD